jgi:hypothetical protein
MATIVDTDALWQTVVASFAAGVGTTLVFALAILGAARFDEATRDGDVGRSVAFAALAVLALLATGAAVVFGVIVMSSK